MRASMMTAALLALALPAAAEVTELRPGRGADVTAANCAACHSDAATGRFDPQNIEVPE